MRVNFRQGIVGHQTGTFLSINGSGHVDLLADNKAFTVNVAHRSTNYIHSEDNTAQSAWIGPFSGTTNFWLYMDFSPLTFNRTFGTTDIEPVAQSAEPGAGNAPISNVVAGIAGIGSFIVPEHYVLEVGRSFTVVGSTGNNGTYTVASATFDGNTGKTTITVDEVIVDATADGELTLDVDSLGNPLLVEGRHWYDTSNDIHFVRTAGGFWSEVLRIFIAQLFNGVFVSQSIDAPLFTGTQVGNTYSVLAGRVIYDESMDPAIRDDRTFLTTEDQFFTNQSRTDGLRLESNVSKAQATTETLAAFTVVAYTGDGEISTADYTDTGLTVLGLLTEDLIVGEIGSVVLQGVVTNPDWNWLPSADVGAEMWAENGLLVTIDPHFNNPVTYPQGNVPVARVLSNDTIIFEQGLGGKGDKGPTGSIANLPPATVDDLGGVRVSKAPVAGAGSLSTPEEPVVVEDRDPRLTDSRNPLPHTHQAIDITYLPGFTNTSNNLQDVCDELSVEKLDKAGGIMTGVLTLVANPTGVLEATTKQYVDNLVSGLIWLDPVDKVNLIADDITVPPSVPEVGDAYIVIPGASGAWSAIPPGNIVTWNGTIWEDNGSLTAFATVPRFGIAFSSSATPSGTFAGNKNNIAIYDSLGAFQGFEAPTNNNAVYVRNPLSEHAFDQYAFSTSNDAWTLFSSGQNLVADGTTIDITGNVISVPVWSPGQLVDANSVQNLDLDALDLRWAPFVHVHSGATISVVPYNSSPDWGTLVDTSNEIVAIQLQNSLQDITDVKAAKTPTYATQAHLPAATNVDGMLAYVQDIQLAYMASNGSWVPMVKSDDFIRLPYDLAFYIAGGMQEDVMVGSFMITRNITIKAGAPDAIAHATSTAADGTYTLDIVHNPSPYSTPVVVGTIAFAIATPLGVITWANDVSFVSGDMLQIRTPVGTPDSNLEELTITIVGCAPTLQCAI